MPSKAQESPVVETANNASAPASKPIRVAMVEDDDFIRSFVAEAVGDSSEFTLIASCRTAEDALGTLPAVRPDVLLMDINLPGLSGIECVRKLKSQMPEAQVLMFTVYQDSRRIFDALLAGASGYILKRTSAAELLEAIRQVHQGGSPMSGHIARQVVQHFNRLGEGTRDVERLSRREKEVLHLLAQGAAYKEIADTLGLSLETIRMYVKSLYAKLHVHSRGEAVAKFPLPQG